ncbi:LOW QUALITY PROTEIN: hypothetical protein ACHAW5_002511 [Stephanodiscus triporus]|uniref:Uncharacterized protein n=1 Tax=Stephanodiscus triporus TaxID=2934178 RepID=A0ABD3Q9M2_9STRA
MTTSELRGIFGEKGDSQNWTFVACAIIYSSFGISHEGHETNAMPNAKRPPQRKIHGKRKARRDVRIPQRRPALPVEERMRFAEEYNTHHGEPPTRCTYSPPRELGSDRAILLPESRGRGRSRRSRNEFRGVLGGGTGLQRRRFAQHLRTGGSRGTSSGTSIIDSTSPFTDVPRPHIRHDSGREATDFSPFTIPDYRNTGTDPSARTTRKRTGLYRDEEVEPDKSKWWANGNIICNELSKPEDSGKDAVLGGSLPRGTAGHDRGGVSRAGFARLRVLPEQEGLSPAEGQRVQGGEPVEPYGFIFDRDDRDPDQDVDLHDAHKFETYAPIVSFYAASPTRFSDIPWPSSEDWEAACGLVFPGSFMHSKDAEGKVVMAGEPRDLFTEANFRKFERSWDDGRIQTAFFRGTATAERPSTITNG